MVNFATLWEEPTQRLCAQDKPVARQHDCPPTESYAAWWHTRRRVPKTTTRSLTGREAPEEQCVSERSTADEETETGWSREELKEQREYGPQPDDPDRSHGWDEDQVA